MGAGNLQGITSRPTTPVTPMIVPMDESAKHQFDQLGDQGMTKLRETKATQWSSILARVWENAAKVALIRGVSANPFAPVIRGSDATWAIGLVRYAINGLIVDVERFVADNQTEQNHKRMLEIVRKAGCKGITMADLSQKARFLDLRPRKEVLQTLVESGQVRCDTRPGKTRPITIYRIN
ncbi:hypothetical protein SIID45300_02274 [Candidatus Magnetaquicoccaceae bacterium FCR-1]|uniref:Uncharacterized protein n=2 Tax=Candidatus Magnetaquiglobus chichijimensis TaxID=3141448 RepID=A0ABQ0CAP6_9PROT